MLGCILGDFLPTHPVTLIAALSNLEVFPFLRMSYLDYFKNGGLETEMAGKNILKDSFSFIANNSIVWHSLKPCRRIFPDGGRKKCVNLELRPTAVRNITKKLAKNGKNCKIWQKR
jgi:hypothetical protein